MFSVAVTVGLGFLLSRHGLIWVVICGIGGVVVGVLSLLGTVGGVVLFVLGSLFG